MASITIAYDYSVRVADGRRSNVVFLRDTATLDVRTAVVDDAPLVASYESMIESVDMRRLEGGLLALVSTKGRNGVRRPSNPFPDLLVPGAVSAGLSPGTRVLSSDRDAVLRSAIVLASSAVLCEGAVYRPTSGLVVSRTDGGNPRVTTIERLLDGRTFDPRHVYDVTDPQAPACRGLQVLARADARGTWDREGAILRYECDTILRGLHADLMEVDLRLARKWAGLVDDLRATDIGPALLSSCEDLLLAFRRRGLGSRAERTLGRPVGEFRRDRVEFPVSKDDCVRRP